MKIKLNVEDKHNWLILVRDLNKKTVIKCAIIVLMRLILRRKIVKNKQKKLFNLLWIELRQNEILLNNNYLKLLLVYFFFRNHLFYIFF